MVVKVMILVMVKEDYITKTMIMILNISPAKIDNDSYPENVKHKKFSLITSSDKI